MLQFGIRAGFRPGSDPGRRFMGLGFQRFSMFQNWWLKKKKKIDTKKSSIIRLGRSVSDFFFSLQEKTKFMFVSFVSHLVFFFLCSR